MPNPLCILACLLSLAAHACAEAAAYTYKGGTVPNGSQAYLMDSGERIIVPPGASVPKNIHWAPGEPRNARRIYMGEDTRSLGKACIYLDTDLLHKRVAVPGAQVAKAPAPPRPSSRGAAWAQGPAGQAIDMAFNLTPLLGSKPIKPNAKPALSWDAPAELDQSHDQAVQAALQNAALTRPAPATK